MATEDVVVQRFDPSRLDELVDAQNEIFNDYIIPMRVTREFFLDFLRSVGGDMRNVLVATMGGRIVGYANPVIDGREAWVGGLGVVPSFRRRGIGTQLMAATEDFCRSRGVTDLYLEVIEGNKRAERLYESTGYSITRKFITAEGRPIRFEGFGVLPTKASMSEIMTLHQRSYRDTCWQKRKIEALIQSARAAECYKTDGGFVLVRTIDTSGYIPFLGVVPEKRKQGLGTALAMFALNRLWGQGAFKVALYNVNDDLPTQRMLDKFDFKVTMKQIEMKKPL
jgi:ribosomal protein S18 acetylase RimI-like enzyme